MIGMVHRILRFSGSNARRIRLAYPVVFLKSLCINVPLMTAYVLLTAYLHNALTVRSCAVSAAVLFGVFLLQALLTNLSDRLQSGTGYRIFAEKRIVLGKHLRRLPMGYFTEGNLGKISSVLSQDMVFIEEQAMTIVADVVSDLFSACITTAFLFWFHPYLGIIVLVTELLAVLLAQPRVRLSLDDAASRQDTAEELTSAVLEYTEGLPVIRSYSMTGESAADLRQAFRKTRTANLDFEKHIVPYETAQLILYGLGMAAILAVSVWLLQTGAIDREHVLGMMLFLFGVFTAIRHLYQQSTRLTIMKACLDRIDALFAEDELPDTGTMQIPAHSEAEIEFRNVSFGYGEKEVLHDISFMAKQGEMTALVGESGGGKSTIANLLARFWDVKSGEILLRGADIRKVPLSDLMSRISMVFQHVYLFQDTVYNNIAMGRPDAAPEEVYEAARKARCYDFIMQMPYGFDTLIGEGGATLSGGEAQRISIARCILKDAPIIILDEATASIDADNERSIQEAMSALCKGKTTLVIAHRLYTVTDADQILVLKDGQIAERGTAQALREKNGIFARLEAANG